MIKAFATISIFLLWLLSAIFIGWFLPPFLAANDLVKYAIIFITSVIFGLYFILRFVYNTQNQFLINTALYCLVVSMVNIFSLSYYRLEYNLLYNGFPSLLVSLVLIDEHLEEKLPSVFELSRKVTELLFYAPFFLGIMRLYQLVFNRITPPFETLPMARKSFLIFKIFYCIVLTIIVHSITEKSKKRITKAVPELLVLVFLFLFYFCVSLYLFTHTEYMDGSYTAYISEIFTYIIITTISIYSIILLEQHENFTTYASKFYLIAVVALSVLFFFPYLKYLFTYLAINHRDLFVIKENGFWWTISVTILGSVASSFALKMIVKKDSELHG